MSESRGGQKMGLVGKKFRARRTGLGSLFFFFARPQKQKPKQTTRGGGFLGLMIYRMIHLFLCELLAVGLRCYIHKVGWLATEADRMGI
jgi:hypothetical protein